MAVRPTSQQCIAAHTGPELHTDGGISQVQATAFRLLFETGKPVDVANLARELDSRIEEIEQSVVDLDRQGLIRRSADGHIVGSVGLSVVPGRDEIHVDGERYWTWCAKTSLGVLAALGRGGCIISRCPISQRQLELAFDASEPSDETALVVFWPSPDLKVRCSSVVDEFCPNISFFENGEAARIWAEKHQVTGEVLTVKEATSRSVERWRPLVINCR